MSAELGLLSLTGANESPKEELRFESFNPFVKKKPKVRPTHRGASRGNFLCRRDSVSSPISKDVFSNFKLDLPQMEPNPFAVLSTSMKTSKSSKSKSKRRETNIYEFDADAFLERVFSTHEAKYKQPLFSSPLPNLFNARNLKTLPELPMPSHDSDLTKALIIYQAPRPVISLQTMIDERRKDWKKLIVEVNGSDEQNSVDVFEPMEGLDRTLIEVPV